MYFPLRVHGHHSMLTGVDSPAALVERAVALGLPGLALADVDTLSGVVDFLLAARAARRRTGRPFRAIVGAEISDPAGASGGAPGRLVALVESAQGYKNLCKLVSARALGADPGVPGAKLDGPEHFRLVESATRYQEGLVFLADHPRLLVELHGRIDARSLFAAISPAALRTKSTEREAVFGLPRNAHLAPGFRVKRRSMPAGRRGGDPDADGFPDDAESELEPPKTPPPEPPAPVLDLILAARATGVATVAVPDVYCAHASGLADHAVRVAIKHNALLVDLPKSWIARAPAHLLAPAEMQALYADVPEVAGPFARVSGMRVPGARAPDLGFPGAGGSGARAADLGFPGAGGSGTGVSGAGGSGSGLPRNGGSGSEGSGTRDPGARGSNAFDALASSTCGALARTLEIGERCAFEPALGGIVFPTIEVEGGEPPPARLRALALAGARERFRPLKSEVLRRLDYELGTIERLGFAPYFLLVKRIADFAREKRIPCVGRGSAADSLVAYCLSLTDADPLRYGLTFERFLNPSRSDRPDIDLDFCWRRRDEVLEHVYGLFGTERTAMIATINRCGMRAAFREAALVLGIPPAEANRWSRRLPWSPHPVAPLRDHGETLPSGASPTRGSRASPTRRAGTNPVAEALRKTPEASGFRFDDARWQRVLSAAARLFGAPRHHGLHPGGVVVAPGPITDFVACRRATKGVVVTQLDKDAVEAIGLVKMDLLGNRALTTIDDCLGGLRARGIVVDLEKIPEDDPATARTLAEGRTLGCFQVESPGMRNLLKQTGACTMDDVIQAIALIRPGPAGSGMKDAYVRRFRKLEEARAPHPRLADLLWGTHGVMLYQEDVMQVAARMAGMDLAEADLLRRALQKRRAGDLEKVAGRFLHGCAAEGIAHDDAVRVWDLVSNFASFAFCKAHAVTYGRISYRAVWLKTHHPAVYLAAFLASETGYYDPRVYVEEARRLSVAILPPDVNRSGRTFAAEESAGRVPQSALRPELPSALRSASQSIPQPTPQSTLRSTLQSTPQSILQSAPQSDPPSTQQSMVPSVPQSILPSALSSASRSAPQSTLPASQSALRPALRIGLSQVKGLSGRTLESILVSRQALGPFVSLPDFLERTAAHKDEVEALIQVGAFDGFDRTRPELLWRLHLLRAPSRRFPRRADADAEPLDPNEIAACRATPASRARRALEVARRKSGGWHGSGLGLGQADLERGESAALFPEPETPALALPRLPDVDVRTRGRLEHELLGITVHAHPTAIFPCPGDRRIAEGSTGSRIHPVNPTSCADLERFVRGRITLRGWPAATRHVRTQDGRTMRFLTLEDESGIAEVVIFPDIYERDGHHLVEFGVLCVTGMVEDQMGACTLHAERVW